MNNLSIPPSTLPEHVWSIITWMPRQPDMEPSLTLWAGEDHALKQAVRHVRHVLTHFTSYGEHYADCAVLDLRAGFIPGQGVTWRSECGGYALKCAPAYVWLSVPGGVKSITAWRIDRRRSLAHAQRASLDQGRFNALQYD